MELQSVAPDEIDDVASAPFVGRWHRLVSTTNWEKGRIICEWRSALRAENAPSRAISDEAWSQRVGTVSPQHVGRLRRTYERFHAVKDSYNGLYWSHFQCALDWDDAEMWLEGAARNRWSVAQMRATRRDALGLVDEHGADVPAAQSTSLDVGELDEDAGEPRSWEDAVVATPLGDAEIITDPMNPILAAGGRAEREDSSSADLGERDTDRLSARPRVRPFAALPPLPPDLDEAIEGCKLVILRHKLAGWKEVAADAVVIHLRALEELSLAPSDL